jgi:8-oxo-dGTP diphosphatase
VLLDVWRVSEYDGEPQALDAQALAWAQPDDLPKHDLLEADRAIVTALRLPRLARVLAASESLDSVRGRAAQTILVPQPPDDAGGLDPDAVAVARAAGHRIFVMGADVDAVRVAAKAHCDGVLLRWQGQSLHVDRSGAFLVGVHCEDAEGARQAVAEGAHFLVIAPEDGTLSERLLARLCHIVGRPVFAGWYPDARRLERLQQAGAHGCAVK